MLLTTNSSRDRVLPILLQQPGRLEEKELIPLPSPAPQPPLQGSCSPGFQEAGSPLGGSSLAQCSHRALPAPGWAGSSWRAQLLGDLEEVSSPPPPFLAQRTPQP